MALLDAPFFVGLLLSWSLAAPPGPANALIAHEATRRGYAAGLLTGLGACTGDVVMFLLMWQGVVRVIEVVPWLQVLLGLAGTILMAKFAVDAWRSATRPVAVDASLRGSFAKSFVIVVTSPFNWAWWLTTGSTLFQNLGILVMVGFFAGLLAWIATWTGLASAGAARFERFGAWVAHASAVVLAVFAVIVGWFTVTRAWVLLGFG